ncbi:hypothetical protein [Dyadobacter sp. CY312]|uniref:hypothetical protein n=1 Tax=Dyadobacter sp. CY312 TaxID=2907303 RepID=UPI001F1B4689|nr:hypothetical protein [Dyadobacter sp. CY312]MCE7042149.1 hypothetical protein [Dyadobacter sp. CY312]
MNIILIVVVTAICQYFAPWWTVALAPFLILLWRPANTSFNAFLTGFAAIALLWFAYGLYLHTSSEGAMSNRIAQIFSLPNGILLLVVTALVGGLVGGFASLSGHFVRRAV